MHPIPKCLSALAVLLVTSTAIANNARKLSNFKSATNLANAIDAWDGTGTKIDAFMVSTDGDWLLTVGGAINRSSGFSDSLFTKIQTKLGNGRRAVAADCNEVGGCVVVYDDFSSSTLNTADIPSCFASQLANFEAHGWPIQDVEITESGCVFIGTGGQATHSNNLDPELQKAILDRKTAGRSIEALAIDFNQEWALIADHNPMSSVLSNSALGATLRNRASASSKKTNLLVMGLGTDYIVQGVTNDPRSTTTPIGNIEWNLGSGSDSIWDRMEALKVTGLSIAVITRTASGPTIKWARGYGRRRADGDLPILGTTPFALASMSKYLGGLTLASQVSADSGVSSTTDIFSGNILPSTGAVKQWEAKGEEQPTGSCTNIADGATGAFKCNLSNPLAGAAPLLNLRKPITLDCLLTHTCSVVGETASPPIPMNLWSANSTQSTLTWLLGRRCGSSSCNAYGSQVWQNLTPGTYDYASANYLVAQAYLEDRTGNSAGAELKSRVLDPIGMPNTVSGVSLSASFQADTAWKHSSANVVDTTLPTTPWVFAGGIWSSAIDYANAMIVALNQGKAANGTQVLTAATVNKVLLNQPPFCVKPRGWGVWFENSIGAGEGTNRAFFHGGSKTGVRAHMCGNPTADEGIVILMNLGGANAITLRDEILSAYLAKVTSSRWRSTENCK